MPSNVSPIAGVDAGINDIRRRAADLDLINADVLPNEGKLWGSTQGRSASDDERDEIRR
jgi:hypothetical protein